MLGGFLPIRGFVRACLFNFGINMTFMAHRGTGWVAGLLLVVGPLWGGESAARLPVGRRLFVEPCSASIRLGKVSLVVTPLIHRGKTCTGNYQLKVSPYFFKNEKGTLVLDASDALVMKLMSGKPASFVGKATNSRNGKVRKIFGKAVPSAGETGRVTFSINTEFGQMVFNTKYHFGD